MPEFTTRPASVEAHQWDGTYKGATELGKWLVSKLADKTAELAALQLSAQPLRFVLTTDFGQFPLAKDDWIIVNANGVVFMANDETFREKYEPVPDTTKELIN